MANQTCNPAVITQALGIQATGPRTVIVPSDPIIWDDSTSYEYLTLVASEGFGQAYISKKDVPAGTPLTDTDYWIPAAQFNAQLANLQREVDTNTTQLANLQREVDTNTTQLANLQGEVDTNTTSINVINSKLAAKGRLLVFGDSWSTTSYTPTAAQMWWSLVANEHNWAVSNYAINGSGWALHQSSTGANLFAEQMDTAHSEYPTSDGISQIIVFGGLNDYSLNAAPNVVRTAVNSVVTKARNYWPGVPLLIVPLIAPIGNGDSAPSPKYGVLGSQIGIGAGNVPHVSGCECLFCDRRAGTYIDASNNHPNTAGQSRIARLVNQALGGGNPNIADTFQLVPAEWSGVTMLSEIRGFATIKYPFIEYTTLLYFNQQNFEAGTYTVAKLSYDGTTDASVIIGDYQQRYSPQGGNLGGANWPDNSYIKVNTDGSIMVSLGASFNVTGSYTVSFVNRLPLFNMTKSY